MQTMQGPSKLKVGTPVYVKKEDRKYPYTDTRPPSPANFIGYSGPFPDLYRYDLPVNFKNKVRKVYS